MKEKNQTQKTPQEVREITVYEYLDKLIIYFPDFDYFSISDFTSNLTDDFIEKCKINKLEGDIRTVLFQLDYAEFAKGSNIKIVLKNKGREAKAKGGHFKYIKSLEPKTDWYKIIPIILSLIFGLTTVFFGYLNYSINSSKNIIETNYEKIKKQNEVLKKEVIKLKSNKSKE